MADNTRVNEGLGGDLVATDEIAGVKYQRVKLVLGADGVNDGDLSTTNPLPISGTVTANPSTYYGKTIIYVPVAQALAGTTVLVAANASNKHKIVGGILTLTLAGTLKFTDGVDDLTGPMTFATNGVLVMLQSPLPYIQTGAVNRALKLVTTLGAANGIVAILTEP